MIVDKVFDNGDCQIIADFLQTYNFVCFLQLAEVDLVFLDIHSDKVLIFSFWFIFADSCVLHIDVYKVVAIGQKNMILREVKHSVWCSLDNLLREHLADALLINWGLLYILNLLNCSKVLGRVILTLSDHPVNVVLQLGSGRHFCLLMLIILLARKRNVAFVKNIEGNCLLSFYFRDGW